jgi:hypothetical protein
MSIFLFVVEFLFPFKNAICTLVPTREYCILIFPPFPPSAKPANTYFWRRKTIRNKEAGNYDDPYGPMVLASTLVLCYASVFALGVSKLASNDSFTRMLAVMR